MIALAVILISVLVYLTHCYAIRWVEVSNSEDFTVVKEGDKRFLKFLFFNKGNPILLFFVEYIYILLNLCFLVIDRFRDFIRKIDDKKLLTMEMNGNIPILLLHGLGMSGLTMFPLKRKLEKSGYNNVFIITYDTTRGIDSYAKKVFEKVDEVIKFGNYKEVNLISHSVGGLAALHFINSYDGSRKVNKFIALGSPFLGTKTWSFSFWKTGKDLAPSSDFISKVGEIPFNVEAVSVYSSFDQIVIPAENCNLKGGYNVKVDNIGHTGFLYDKKIYKIIDSFLKK